MKALKKFEFRKSIFKKQVSAVVVYVSAPLQQVIGEFEIEQILHLDLETLWDITHLNSGISKSFFMNILKIKKEDMLSKSKIQNYTKYLKISRKPIICFRLNHLPI